VPNRCGCAGFSARCCSIGNAKAAVLPVPVWATPSRSRPASRCGMAVVWIGVGSMYRALSRARSSGSARPRVVKEFNDTKLYAPTRIATGSFPRQRRAPWCSPARATVGRTRCDWNSGRAHRLKPATRQSRIHGMSHYIAVDPLSARHIGWASGCRVPGGLTFPADCCNAASRG